MLISELEVELLEMLAIAVVEWVIFTNSLIGTTIQDGGKRERTIVSKVMLGPLYFILFLFLFYLFSLIWFLFFFYFLDNKRYVTTIT